MNTRCGVFVDETKRICVGYFDRYNKIALKNKLNVKFIAFFINFYKTYWQH